MKFANWFKHPTFAPRKQLKSIKFDVTITQKWKLRLRKSKKFNIVCDISNDVFTLCKFEFFNFKDMLPNYSELNLREMFLGRKKIVIPILHKTLCYACLRTLYTGSCWVIFNEKVTTTAKKSADYLTNHLKKEYFRNSIALNSTKNS